MIKIEIHEIQYLRQIGSMGRHQACLVPEIKYGAAAAGPYLISYAHAYAQFWRCLAIGEGIVK